MNNYKVEAEIHHQYLEQELSQEVHMLNQARILIEEMRRHFTIEDQGCIRRIEMLETQSNEYAAGLIEIGNHAEAELERRTERHSEEIQGLKHRVEAYLGHQNEDMSRLRNDDLAYANSKLQQSNLGRTQTNHNEREIAHMNEVLSSELLMSKANSQHHEAEVSLMQNALQSRSSILQSEVANLQSII